MAETDDPYRRSAGIALIALLASACGGAGTEAGTAVVSDSAGVRIVENAGPPVDTWRVEAEPIFTVGWNPGDPHFTWLQSGHIMPNGEALVGDFTAGTIYRIGTDGAVLENWGRKGEGPGEYQALDAILGWGDSILVSDGRLGRITLLSPEGEVWATRALSRDLSHASAVLADGRILIVPGEGYGPPPAETRAEWFFETQPIVAMDPESGATATLAELPTLRRWLGIPGGNPGWIHVKGRSGGFPDGFAWARSDVREVRWYDGAGGLTQVARWDEAPIPLTPEWRREFAGIVEEGLRASGAPEAFVTAQLTEMEEWLDRHDGPLPYWDSFHVDRSGNVWMGRYTQPMQPPERWRVISRDGVLVGWVDLPDIITILDITDGRILAVRLDELQVPAVLMMELIRP